MSRLFGWRAFSLLAASLVLGFALVLALVWRQSSRGPAALETAVPVVLLDAAPDVGDTQD